MNLCANVWWIIRIKPKNSGDQTSFSSNTSRVCVRVCSHVEWNWIKTPIHKRARVCGVFWFNFLRDGAIISDNRSTRAQRRHTVYLSTYAFCLSRRLTLFPWYGLKIENQGKTRIPLNFIFRYTRIYRIFNRIPVQIWKKKESKRKR